MSENKSVSSISSTSPAIQANGIYTAVFNLKLKEGTTHQFLEGWHILADYCRANEPNTYTYEAHVSNEDNTKVMIFERYRTKDDLVVVHANSPAYAQFGKTCGPLIESKTVTFFSETGLGYLSSQQSGASPFPAPPAAGTGSYHYHYVAAGAHPPPPPRRHDHHDHHGHHGHGHGHHGHHGHGHHKKKELATWATIGVIAGVTVALVFNSWAWRRAFHRAAVEIKST